MDQDEAKRLNRIAALTTAADTHSTRTADEIVAAAQKYVDFLNEVTTDRAQGDRPERAA